MFRLGAPTNGGRKDIHFNDRSVIRGAFEGFSGGGLEKLNTWYKMLLYTNILHHAMEDSIKPGGGPPDGHPTGAEHLATPKGGPPN